MRESDREMVVRVGHPVTSPLVRHLRRLPIALLLASALLLSACGDSYQVAASFGGEEISHADLADEALAWADSAQLLSLFFAEPQPNTSDAFTTADISGVILTIKINAAAARELLEEAGTRTDEAESAIRPQFEGARGALSDAQLTTLIEDIAAIDTYGTLAASQVYDDIYVSPRYGSYDPDSNFVVIPEGPRPAPGAGFDFAA